MNYYAHTATLPDGANDPNTERWQLLSTHLHKVANLAEKFAAPLNLCAEAKLAGLLHDLGKYRDEFQAYLRGERGSSVETQHAIFGAAWAMERSLASTLPVAGHHAGLHDCGDLPGMLAKPALRITQTLPELITRLETELGPLPPLPTPPAWVDDELSAEFYTRLIFSCLVDADRLDTACWPETPLPDCVLQTAQLLEQVHTERSSKAKAAKNPGSPLAVLRNRIFDTAIERAALPPGFFSLSSHIVWRSHHAIFAGDIFNGRSILTTLIMSAKETLLDIAEKLPPDATLVDAIYELEFRQAVEEGLAELDRGEGIPIEQVKSQIATWAGK